MDKYHFRKYNPEYIKFFANEAEKIRKALGPKAKIEHVGSTAIPNLGGKGIVDILIGVDKGHIVMDKVKLAKAGYEFRDVASTQGRSFFRIDYPYKSNIRRIHIHLTKYKSRDWNEIIFFRNYMLENPLAVEQYSKIKKEGVKIAMGDGESYRDYKKKFIKDILKLA